MELTDILLKSNGNYDGVVLTIKEMFLSGEIDPLKLRVELKPIENAIKAILDDEDVKAAVLNAAAKYPEKEFSVYGAKISKGATATYDYSHDFKWKEIERKKKEREAFLKNATPGLFDTEDGTEVIPAIKKSTEFIKISL